jgi:hypothetical protein
MTAEPRPDLEIATEATARELRFWRRPEDEIRAGEQVGERAHLPQPVQLRHIHHHVRAAMRAMSRLTGRIGA